MHRVFLFLMLCAIVLSHAGAVFAHGGPPRVEIGDTHASAGDSLEVRGINLGADLEVAVTLVGGDTVIPLGSAICDGQGDFTAFYNLPQKLAAGSYTVRAVNSSDQLVETHLEIEGAVSVARLQRWMASLPGVQWSLLLGALALVLGIIAGLLHWKERQTAVKEG